MIRSSVRYVISALLLAYAMPVFGINTNDNTSTETKTCQPLNRFVSCHQFATIAMEGPTPQYSDTSRWNPQAKPQQEQQSWLKAHFQAFEKEFRLILYPTFHEFQSTMSSRRGNLHPVLSQSAKITTVKGNGYTKKINPQSLGIKLYSGYIQGEKTSSVTVSISNRKFSGTIELENATYILEPKCRYYGNASHSDVVVYREKDVAYHLLSRRYMKLRSGSLSVPVALGIRAVPLFRHSYKESGLPIHQPFTVRRLYDIEPVRRVCHLSVVVDYTFYRGIGRGDVDDTISEILYYYSETNQIFQTSDFDANGAHDNIGFMIDEITVYEDPLDPGNPAPGESDSDRYLDIFSKNNFDGFCLATVFTHRDFDDGVIGLAWMASSSRYTYPGGICQRRVLLEASPNYERGYYSFNTLLVSSLNYGITIPRHVNALTLAHEIGHAFGAPHDEMDDQTCSPGGISGNFIMHPYATDGDNPNNYRFSVCSKAHISPVLERKGGCLERINGSSCGNIIVEAGEDCDCGSEELCQKMDRCCEPPGSTLGGCRFAVENGRLCSPKSSPCCDNGCQYIHAENQTMCSPETDCSLASLCNGTSEFCPASMPKPDGTLCDNEKGVCHKGRCTNNFCQIHNLSECQCVEYGYQCHLCCTPVKGSAEECIPAIRYNITDAQGMALYRSPGQTCNTYKGYCDQQLRCIHTDRHNTLDRFRDAFSSGTLGKNVVVWIQNYWYLLLMAVLFMIFFACILMTNRTSKIDTEVNQQVAKLAKLWQQTRYETSMIEKDLADLDKKYKDELARLNQPKPLDSPVSLTRLWRFFPTVGADELRRVASNFSSEEFAVRQLIIRGHPMHKQSIGVGNSS